MASSFLFLIHQLKLEVENKNGELLVKEWALRTGI